ncbi:hypothetical protein BJV74DRAFT_170112 [Russula compacta]|nr:hypothetical protein BJV74DRAFT_170112 [Russula compacta]
MGKALNWEETGSQVIGHKQSINVLPDDVLLEIFHIFRLKSSAWSQKVWCKLVHTCRRWRHIIFSSPSRLDLSLYCTRGAPVADMLNHFPPLPLIVSYGRGLPLTAKDEEGALLALQQHDRVRSIVLGVSSSTLEKFFAVMNRSFPALKLLELSGPAFGRP